MTLKQDGKPAEVADPRIAVYTDRLISGLITLLLAVCIWVVNGLRADIDTTKEDNNITIKAVSEVHSTVSTMKEVNTQTNVQITSTLEDIKKAVEKVKEDSGETRINIAVLKVKVDQLEDKQGAP